MKLLIVDDEYIAIEGVMNGVNWDSLGFEQVFQAYSYSQAVDILQKNYIEVLLCDIEMPDGTGLELVEWVNTHSPDTQCIIMSCHDEFDYARQALSLHCMDYVLKPVRYPALTAVLKKAMETVEERRHRQRMASFGQQYIDMVSGRNKDENEDAVEKVERYIREHIAEELSVKNLADMVYVGTDHLTRIFKKRYGKTVTDYILEQRMNLAGELLKDQRLTVTMVSDAVGFGNYSYFTEQFKRAYGKTPREYRKQFR
ncbi:MAG: AraC family transcriptional regulator [Faecousia sp.]